MANFWPVFFFLLFSLSFGEVATSNGNVGSEVVNVVKVAKQSIQTRGGAINEYQKELAAKQTHMKQGIVVQLSLNEIGEIIKFLGETFLQDYFVVLGLGDEENFYLLENLKKLIEKNEKESHQKNPKGIQSTSVSLSAEKNAHAKLVNILMPSLLSSPTINEFCSKNSDFQCAAIWTESLYKFGAFLMHNLLNFCRKKSNTKKCWEWWHLFREKLKDSVASEYWPIGAKNPNPEQMYYYMTYIQYFRRWRNKMNKFTIPLAHMLKWADDSRTKSNEEEEQQIEKEMSLGKLVDEAMKTPKFRIVYVKKEINSPQRKLSEKQESQKGNDKDTTKNGRRPVIARLYYYYLDRKTGEGNNHGAVILDDTEFHFSDNAGVEIYLKDGYTAKAEEHDTDVMFDYHIGFTSKTQREIQSILDKLAEGRFAPGKFKSEKGNQAASNNCVTFLKDFIYLILDRPPAKWPYPLSKAFYGTFKQFSDEMAEYLTNSWLKWEKGLVRARTATRAPTVNTWRH